MYLNSFKVGGIQWHYIGYSLGNVSLASVFKDLNRFIPVSFSLILMYSSWGCSYGNHGSVTYFQVFTDMTIEVTMWESVWEVGADFPK